MKFIVLALCVAMAFAAPVEESAKSKRGILSAPLLSHAPIAAPLISHASYASPLLSHASYAAPLALPALHAPLAAHSLALPAAPLAYSAPLGLGHGLGYGLGGLALGGHYW